MPVLDELFYFDVKIVSRAPVTAPPGFSGPTRAPPPGFTSFERMEQSFDINSGLYSTFHIK